MKSKTSNFLISLFSKIGIFMEREIFKHWILFVNLSLLSLILLSLLAPFLLYAGWKIPAQIIYNLLHFLCHQKEERCFIFMGYKMGLCSRCFALFVSFFVVGVFYSFIRNIYEVRTYKSITFYALAVFMLPLVIDGITQLFGFRESTQGIRVLTGILAGVGIGIFVFPSLERAFK